jgi:serine/threonine protein kinase
LLDFGLVTELGLRHLDGPADARVVGTPTYMSPEQAAGQTVSEGTDWYSTGVMLYEALTGRVPFSGDFVAMLNQKQQHEAPAPGDAVPDIPEDLSALCRDLLWSDPTRRLEAVKCWRASGARRPHAQLRVPTTVTSSSQPASGGNVTSRHCGQRLLTRRWAVRSR